MRRLATLVLATAVAAPAAAADFYVDPANGSPAGDGSAMNPWRTLQEVVEANLIETRHWESLPYQPGSNLIAVNPGAPVQAGDTIWLRGGYHGELFVRGAYNAATITVAAEPGQIPQLSRVLLSAAQNWVVRGVSISPSHAPGPLAQGTIVFVENHGWHGPSWDIEIERLRRLHRRRRFGVGSERMGERRLERLSHRRRSHRRARQPRAQRPLRHLGKRQGRPYPLQRRRRLLGRRPARAG